MTWRIWRYTGSDAVMISELVAGSACTWPPVDGRAEAATGVVDCADAPPAVPEVPEGAFGFCVTVVRPSPVGAPPVPPDGPPPPLPVLPAEMAARSSSAIFTASEFFRYTPQMLPAGPPPAVGWSSLSM